MGLVYADIELINAVDLGMAKRQQMDEDEVRRMHVNMLADSGSYMMAINENIREILKLEINGKKRLELANGIRGEYDVAGPIEVRYEDRTATCNAVVLPGDSEPLLGAIPMEEMGVSINPQYQELTLHPEPYHRLTALKPCKRS